MVCRVCLKEMEYDGVKNIFIKQILCKACFNEMNIIFEKFYIENKYKALALYEYSQNIKSIIINLKKNKDYEIAEVFLHYYLYYFSIKYAGFTIVFAPSYFEDDLKRGFNHVMAIFEKMKNKKLNILHKNANVHQMGSLREKRSEIIKYLYIDDVDLSKTKVLLVDDVYTTGSTIKASIKLLETKNPKCIEVLVISRRIMKPVELY